MANKLSSRDRELLSTQQQRKIGLRPYENGYFGELAADFILFELFDASGNFGGTVLNNFWAKGPVLINNLLGILLRFREGQIAITGDIRKMYHSIKY